MHKRKHDEIDLLDDVERIKEALAIATKDVRGRATDIFNHSKERLSDASEDLQNNVTGYVSDKPLKSLGLAALTGFIIGYLLRK